MKKRKEREFYRYTCSITGEEFTTTRRAPNPSELISVKGYYQLNSDKDDRPLLVKKQLGLMDEPASEGEPTH